MLSVPSNPSIVASARCVDTSHHSLHALAHTGESKAKEPTTHAIFSRRTFASRGVLTSFLPSRSWLHGNAANHSKLSSITQKENKEIQSSIAAQNPYNTTAEWQCEEVIQREHSDADEICIVANTAVSKNPVLFPSSCEKTHHKSAAKVAFSAEDSSVTDVVEHYFQMRPLAASIENGRNDFCGLELEETQSKLVISKYDDATDHQGNAHVEVPENFGRKSVRWLETPSLSDESALSLMEKEYREIKQGNGSAQAEDYASKRVSSCSNSSSTSGSANYNSHVPLNDVWNIIFARRPSFSNRKNSSWSEKKKGAVVARILELKAKIQKVAIFGDNEKTEAALIEFCKFCAYDSFALDPNERHGLLNNCFDILRELCFKGVAEGQYVLGKAYMEDGHYASAYVLLYNAAIQSFSPACSKVAGLLVRGLGTEEDIPSAISFLRKGVILEDCECAYRLGVCYAHGRFGLEVDFAEAVKLLQDCLKARGGHRDIKAKAHYELGQIYEAGSDRVPKNFSSAFSNYNDSASMGFLPAVTKIGECYASGKLGVKVDRKKAKTLLQSAAVFGNDKAKDLLSKYFN